MPHWEKALPRRRGSRILTPTPAPWSLLDHGARTDNVDGRGHSALECAVASFYDDGSMETRPAREVLPIVTLLVERRAHPARAAVEPLLRRVAMESPELATLLARIE